MPRSRIVAELQKAADFGQQIENLIINRGRFEVVTHRTPLVMGYWSLTFEIHKAIVCLISSSYFGAAFALLRPIVESTVRTHIAIMCSDVTLHQLRQDKYRTNLATIGKEIDAYFEMGTVLQDFLTQARDGLHSFTHAGLKQLNRRFTGNDLAPNYSDQELVGLIRVATSAIFMVNNIATKHLGFEEGWKRNTHLFAQWGKH